MILRLHGFSATITICNIKRLRKEKNISKNILILVNLITQTSSILNQLNRFHYVDYCCKIQMSIFFSGRNHSWLTQVLFNKKSFLANMGIV